MGEDKCFGYRWSEIDKYRNELNELFTDALCYPHLGQDLPNSLNAHICIGVLIYEYIYLEREKTRDSWEFNEFSKETFSIVQKFYLD